MKGISPIIAIIIILLITVGIAGAAYAYLCVVYKCPTSSKFEWVEKWECSEYTETVFGATPLTLQNKLNALWVEFGIECEEVEHVDCVIHDRRLGEKIILKSVCTKFYDSEGNELDTYSCKYCSEYTMKKVKEKRIW